MEREGCNADQIQLAREVLHSLKYESDPLSNLRNIERRRLTEKVNEVNKILTFIETKDITQTNELILGAGRVVEDEWKTLERLRSGELHNIAVCEGLERRYYLKKKGVVVVLEELKQRILAKTGKVERYQSRIEQYRQNRIFQSNQKRLFEMLGNEERDNSVVPDIEESMRFWSSI